MAKINTIVRIAKTFMHDVGMPEHNRHQVSAIVADQNGKIISKAINSYIKTHPIMAVYANKISRPDKIYLHAEIAALVKCRKQPHTLYVFRFLKNGRMALAKPCPMCELALREAGVKKVVYTSENGINEYCTM